MLRQGVVEDVLIANPILKAVHSGANATPTERSVAHRARDISLILKRAAELYIP